MSAQKLPTCLEELAKQVEVPIFPFRTKPKGPVKSTDTKRSKTTNWPPSLPPRRRTKRK